MIGRHRTNIFLHTKIHHSTAVSILSFKKTRFTFPFLLKYLPYPCFFSYLCNRYYETLITMNTKEKILDLLSKNTEPMSAGQIADALKTDRKEIDKSMAELKKTQAITSPRRCFWTVSKA